MLNTKTYACGICNTKPDQISHHKSHIETQKHKDKREIFEFKLLKLTDMELEKIYKTKNINDIINETERVLYSQPDTKLNESTSYANIYTTEEINSLRNIMIEQCNSISNKEALRDKIHEIHNYLRNHGAGYGMNALQVFNLLYGLKKIEENGLLDTVGLKRPDCEFSYLLKLANENKDEQLAELIFGNVLQSICDSELKELLFYEIPQNIRGSVFVYLIKEINTITMIEKTCNVLLSGKIYEYFIGRDESAISELGAYFTDRHIVEYILKMLNPIMNEDGTIPSMIDMFGGSGGFTTGYIHYLNEKYPGLINWTNELQKVSHFDMNEDVIKSAGLEFFCLTGVLPNMNNLRYKNSFTDEFNGQKYKYPLTNPPYGGDKNTKSKAQDKREKVKEYIKTELPTITDEGVRIQRQTQLKNIELLEKQERTDSEKAKVSVSMCSGRIQKFAKDNGLKGNDKESCSLMLLMDILDIGGTAIGVLKEGVFFNKAYKNLRKCLVENYNVREVISVPQDQFENTSTKTSIIIFDNNIDVKTTQIKFSDLVIERYTEDRFAEVLGEVVIIENKNDIVGVSDKFVSVVTREELVENAICSFNPKDYGKKDIVVGDGYKLVRLGDVCRLENGKQLDKKNIIAGNYPVYGGGLKPVGYHNEYNRENSTIIAGTGHCGFVQFDENKFWASQSFTIKSNDDLINKWLFVYCKSQETYFMNSGGGSVQKFIRAKQFENLQIPIPKSPAKIQEWVDKIATPYKDKTEKQTQMKELETFIQNRIIEIVEKEDCDKLNFDEVLQYAKKKNKYQANDGKIEGKYRFYTSSQDKVLYRDDFEFKNNHILIGRGGVASLHLSSKFSVSHDDVYVLTARNLDYDLKFIYNYMKINIKLIEDSFKGSTIKHCSKTSLSQIKIHLPKNKQLIQDLEPVFQQIETLQNEVKLAEVLYKQLIQELGQEAIPQRVVEQVVPEVEVPIKNIKIIRKKVIKSEPIIENGIEQTI